LNKLVHSTEIFPSGVETGNSTFYTYNLEQTKGKMIGVLVITLNKDMYHTCIDAHGCPSRIEIKRMG
jgi:hypothetical protein